MLQPSWVVCNVLLPVSKAVSSAHSSSSSSQVTASARLLLVLVARSLVVLHGALEAAAAAAGKTPAKLLQMTENLPSLQDSSSSWQQYEASLVKAGGELTAALQPAVQQQQPGANCCWPHLLQLHDVPQLVAAVQVLQQSFTASCCGLMDITLADTSSRGSGAAAALDAGRTTTGQTSSGDQPSTQQQEQEADEQQQQPEQQQPTEDPIVSQLEFVRSRLARDVFSFCRVLAAAVPLPEVCNNPSCRSLYGVSEAAAAVKACGGCGARYCSVQCQQAHWKVHRKACRRLQHMTVEAGQY
jgi:hypothetical protein